MLVSHVLGNTLWVHPIGYATEVLYVWIYNKYIHNKDSSLSRVYLPAMIAAFYTAPKSPDANGKKQAIEGNQKRWRADRNCLDF